ncbi:hypothetical protein WICPIJ_007467 [Wickerhamomyces pijperi]|uniref:Uncharacterized protein n=1 Tax=Wickerhamomyces pijperi TaxID=599730 RepID=A0A9P8Q087_WICPI|nr:hypothetical protein WICPIJ_007467 [Wickerhamomyces pijperi]
MDWLLGQETLNNPIRCKPQCDEVVVKTYGNLSNGFMALLQYFEYLAEWVLAVRPGGDVFAILQELGTLGYAVPMLDVSLLTETVELKDRLAGE